MPKLKNPRREKFIQLVAKGKAHNAAAIEAGFSEHTADVKASQLMNEEDYPEIAARLEELQTKVEEANILDRQTCLEKLREIVNADYHSKTATVPASTIVRAIEVAGKIQGWERKTMTVKVKSKRELSDAELAAIAAGEEGEDSDE